MWFYVNMYDAIREEQDGFRHGYSTTDYVFVLQSIISKHLCCLC